MKDIDSMRDLIMTRGSLGHKENMCIYNKFLRKKNLDRYILLLFQKYHMNELKILDVGCQYGHFLIHLSDSSVGIDIDEKAVNFAKSIGLKAINHNIESGLPFDNGSFEGIFCSHVLEHMSSPNKLLKEINRVLASNSISIFVVPRHCRFSKGYANSDHIYAFTLNTFEFMLERAGFQIIEKIGYVASIPCISIKMLNCLLKLTSTQCLIVAKKKEVR